MNLLRGFRRWVSGHDPHTESTIVSALKASKDVEHEAKRLRHELDRIKDSPDPLGELVKSMRTAKFNGH